MAKQAPARSRSGTTARAGAGVAGGSGRGDAGRLRVTDPTVPQRVGSNAAPQKRWYRPKTSTVLKVTAGVLVLLLLYYLVTFVQVWWIGRRDEARPVDAIVVMGAAQYDGRPSPVLAARLDHALALYEKGHSDVVVVTGGNREGDRFTEASASAEYLMARGIPDGQILREDRGRTTWESLVDVAAILKERHLDTVLLVSDRYHLMRAAGTAREVGLVPFTSPTPSSPVGTMSQVRETAKEAVGVSIARFTGYRRLWRIDSA